MERNITNEEPKNLYLLPNGLISYCRTSNEDIEYTHTDALIDKACEWLEHNVWESTGWDSYELSEAFKNYMKGDNK